MVQYGMPPSVYIIGPRNQKSPPVDHRVMTVSISKTELERGFSPFFLGPIPLPDGTMASCVENCYQFSKTYPQHVDGDVLPGINSGASPTARRAIGNAVQSHACL